MQSPLLGYDATVAADEARLIRQLQTILGPGLTESDDLLAPVFGDDAALIRLPDRTLVVTQDMLVEEVDFRRDWGSLVYAGYKAAMANLSDLAAKGATPKWGFCSVACPPKSAAEDIADIYRGIREAISHTGLVIAGGDLSATDGPVSIDMTLIGEIPASEPLWLRMYAKVGDVVWVSGAVGRARIGLQLLERRLVDDSTEDHYARRTINAQRKPAAETSLAQSMRRSGYQGACMDVSDGLLRDVPRLADASKVGIEIDPKSLPLKALFYEEACMVAARYGLEIDPEENALIGGEDFVLLGACSEDVLARMPTGDSLITPIGRCVVEPGVRLRDGDTLRPWPTGGFDHFAVPGS